MVHNKALQISAVTDKYKGKYFYDDGYQLKTYHYERIPFTADKFYLFGVCLKDHNLVNILIPGTEVEYMLSHYADGSAKVIRVYIGGNDTGKLTTEELKSAIVEWCLEHFVDKAIYEKIIENVKPKKSVAHLKPRRAIKKL